MAMSSLWVSVLVGYIDFAANSASILYNEKYFSVSKAKTTSLIIILLVHRANKLSSVNHQNDNRIIMVIITWSCRRVWILSPPINIISDHFASFVHSSVAITTTKHDYWAKLSSNIFVQVLALLHCVSKANAMARISVKTCFPTNHQVMILFQPKCFLNIPSDGVYKSYFVAFWNFKFNLKKRD